MKIKWEMEAQATSSLRYMSMRGDLSKITKELTINNSNMIVTEDNKLNWDNQIMNMKVDTSEGTSTSGKSQTGSLIHLWWLSSPQKEAHMLEIINQQTSSNSSISATIIIKITQLIDTITSSNMLIPLIRVKKSHLSQPSISPTSCIIRQIPITTITTLHLWTQRATTYAQQLTTRWCNIITSNSTPTAITINSLWSW